MESFKEYYKNKILTESPMRLGIYFPDYMDDMALNVDDAKTLIDKNSYTELNLPYLTYQLKYINDVHDTINYDYFIDPMPLIVALFMYKKSNGGIIMDSVWKFKMKIGMAYRLLIDYYLQKYDFIISDNKHTTQGEDFWKRVIDYGTKNGNKLSVLLKNGTEIDIDDKERFWGNTPEFYDYRIKIYKK